VGEKNQKGQAEGIHCPNFSHSTWLSFPVACYNFLKKSTLRADTVESSTKKFGSNPKLLFCNALSCADSTNDKMPIGLDVNPLAKSLGEDADFLGEARVLARYSSCWLLHFSPFD
jgi:hypothetical protein